MLQIRKGVFETNSSSTHSISIEKQSDVKDYNDLHLYMNNNNEVETMFGSFGWSGPVLTTVAQKLSYLLALVTATELSKYFYAKETRVVKEVSESGWEYVKREDDFLENGEEAELEKIYTNLPGYIKIKEALEAKGYKLVFKPYNSIHIYTYSMDSWYPLGTIDHQSCKDYNDLEDFLNCNSISSVEEFLFDPKVSIIIDNDNDR